MNWHQVTLRTPCVQEPRFNLQDSYEQKGLDIQKRHVSPSAAAMGLKSEELIPRSISTLTTSILSQRLGNILVPTFLTQAQVKPN